MKTLTPLLATALLSLAFTTPAALPINYNNKGADGGLNPTGATYVVDLSLAQTRNWDAAPDMPSHGVYDSNRWAVVFKFTNINLSAGTTVTFKNHPSHAPVVWLVDGDATIAGTVNLDGTYKVYSAPTFEFGEPGPGGFPGGAGAWGGVVAGGGRGPGGAFVNRSGSYGTIASPLDGTAPPTYGNERIMPLVGGSGGAGTGNNIVTGGGGGGAMLLVVSGTLTLTGTNTARGGAPYYDGSGGAFRIIADRIIGNGLIDVSGRTSGIASGHGRIRLETLNLDQQIRAQPPTVATNPLPITLWPETNQTTARIISVGGLNAPADPRAAMQYALPSDVNLSAGNRTNLIEVETRYLSTNALVVTRIVPRNGTPFSVTNDFFADLGTNTLRWRKSVVLSPGYHAMQVRAIAP